MDIQKWEPRFKACGALAAIVSALGLVAGGAFGLYTFRQQGISAEAQREKEFRLMQFNLKKEVYYELVEAAATVATSPTVEDAIKNAAKYKVVYFGRAHMFAIDPTVSDAKIAFYRRLLEVLEKGKFPTTELEGATLQLSIACMEVLRVRELFAAEVTK